MIDAWGIIREALTKEIAKDVAKQLGIDFAKEEFTLASFAKGMKVELEHKDVTKGDPLATGKIALAHLKEVPDYYEKLAKHVE